MGEGEKERRRKGEKERRREGHEQVGVLSIKNLYFYKLPLPMYQGGILGESIILVY